MYSTALIIIIGIALALSLFPFSVFAADTFFDKLNKVIKGMDMNPIDPNNAQSTLGGYLGTILAALLSFLGVIFMLLSIYAGFLWMTARGNDDQVRKAQKILQTSITGLVIVALAYGITRLVDSLVGGL